MLRWLPPFFIYIVMPYTLSFSSHNLAFALSVWFCLDSVSTSFSMNYISPFLLYLTPHSSSNLFLYLRSSSISSSLSSGPSHKYYSMLSPHWLVVSYFFFNSIDLSTKPVDVSEAKDLESSYSISEPLNVSRLVSKLSNDWQLRLPFYFSKILIVLCSTTEPSVSVGYSV